MPRESRIIIFLEETDRTWSSLTRAQSAWNLLGTIEINSSIYYSYKISSYYVKADKKLILEKYESYYMTIKWSKFSTPLTSKWSVSISPFYK